MGVKTLKRGRGYIEGVWGGVHIFLFKAVFRLSKRFKYLRFIVYYLCTAKGLK